MVMNGESTTGLISEMRLLVENPKSKENKSIGDIGDFFDLITGPLTQIIKNDDVL